MKKIKFTSLILPGFLLILTFMFSGCYTQLSKPGSGWAYYEDDDEQTVEEYEEADADTIVIRESDRYDVYERDWHPTVFVDSWWYEPYWYYGSSYWWRYHHRWDPWWGYSSYYGDPWYWAPYSYYGGYAYYGDPYYSGYYGGSGYYYDDGQSRDFKRRTFTYGHGPGNDLGMTPRRLTGSANSGNVSAVGRTWSPRSGSGDNGSTIVNDWYDSDSRRSTDPATGGNTVKRSSGGTVERTTPSINKESERPAVRKEGSTSQPAVRKTRPEGTRSGTVPKIDRSGQQDRAKETPRRPADGDGKKSSGTEVKKAPRSQPNSSSRSGNSNVSHRRSSTSRSSSGSVSRSSSSGSSNRSSSSGSVSRSSSSGGSNRSSSSGSVSRSSSSGSSRSSSSGSSSSSRSSSSGSGGGSRSSSSTHRK